MRRKNNYSILGILGVVAVITFIIVLINQHKQKTLPTYQGGTDVEKETPTEAPPEISSKTYVAEDGTYSLLIPDDWTEVHRNGGVEFIHAPSSTSVFIDVRDYTSSINNIDETTVSADITGSGYSFVSFARFLPTAYEAIYQKTDKKIYDYITETYWSREQIVELKFTLLDENFNKMKPYIENIYNSFQWGNKVDVVPEGYHLLYIEYGDFEFGVPTDWTVNVEGTSIVGRSTDGTMMLTVSAQEYTDNLSKLTSYDISSLMKTGRENGFILNNFSSTATSATGEAQYTDNNGNMITNQTYLFVNGVYLYTLQLDFITGAADETVLNTCAGLFREFLTKKLADYYRDHPEATEVKTEENTEAMTENGSETEEMSSETVSETEEQQTENVSETQTEGINPTEQKTIE